MAITVGTPTSAVDTANDDSLVINKPAGVVENDVLFAVVGIRGADVSAAPSGWTEITQVDGSSGTEHRTYWKKAGPSEPADYTWTLTGNNQHKMGGITPMSGAADPGVTAPISGEATGSNSPVAPSLTIPSDDHMVFAVGFPGWEVITGYPSGETLDYDVTDGDQDLAVTHKEFDTGATGTASFSGSGSNTYGASRVAFAPSGGGGGAPSFVQTERGIRGLNRGVSRMAV